jgi:hypothetical protein
MHYKTSLLCLLILFLSTAVAAFAMEGERFGEQTEMEHLMPLYEIWILDWMCSNPRYQGEFGSSRMNCIRAVRNVLPHCNAEYRKKIPRNDSQATGERLRYRDFMAGYTRCLEQRNRERRHDREDL